MPPQQANLQILQECVDHCRQIGALTEADPSLRLRVLVQMLRIELEKTVREVAELGGEDA